MSYDTVTCTALLSHVCSANDHLCIFVFFLIKYSNFLFLICSVCILPYLWQQQIFDSSRTILKARGWLLSVNTGCKSFKQTRGILITYIRKFLTFQYRICTDFQEFGILNCFVSLSLSTDTTFSQAFMFWKVCFKTSECLGLVSWS